MRCEEIRELLPLHALGALEAPDAAAVRAHLDSGCPKCAAELAGFSATVAEIPFALPAEDAPSRVKSRLLAAVREERAERESPIPQSPRGLWLRAVPLAAAASLVAAVLTGAIVSRSFGRQAEALRTQIQFQKARLAALEEQSRRTRETILLVRSPGSRVIDLQGQEDRAESAARVFWDARRGKWTLYADRLPPAGAGKTYQLWLVTDREKISAGTFDPSAAEEATGEVTVPPDAGTVIAAAVTPEPEGGSPQPTGKILLLGKI
jgi:anti-sigma-K factor RskA